MNVPIVWRLLYADGREITEDPDNTMSISNSYPNPIELHVIDSATKQPIVRINMRGYIPIWYRKMYIDIRPGDLGQTKSKNSYTVFGRVHDGALTYEGQCWIYKNGIINDCPNELIEEGTIRSLIQRSGGR